MLRSIQDYFQDESKFWTMFSIILAVFAALKGLRLPGLWAATQSQLDYSQGFIKRGLMGAIFNALGIHHYLPLTIAFFALLAVFFVTLALLTRRSGITSTLDQQRIVAAFASSYAITYLTHIVGYLDIPTGILAMLLLLIAKPQNRFLAALPVIAIASLIHESFLFLYAPAVLLTFVLDGFSAADARSRKRTWLYGITLTIYAFAFPALTSFKPNLTPAKIAALKATITAHADFTPRPDIFPLMSFGLRNNLSDMMTMPHNKLWLEWQVISIFLVAPCLLLLVHLCLRLLRQTKTDPPTARLLKAATLLSIFSPLTMHLLGWDAVRWNVLCLLAAYLTLLVLLNHLPPQPFVLSTAEKNAILLIIAINMVSGYGLFDHQTVNPYPFFPKVLNWLWVIKHPGQPLNGL